MDDKSSVDKTLDSIREPQSPLLKLYGQERPESVARGGDGFGPGR
jgi:hypothetical protein